jgi:pyruvate,orthophosphate dikinase
MTYIYAFDHKHRKSPMSLKDLLGGKGANLAEMMSVLHLPVPHGFTVTTDACRDYMHGGWPKTLDKEITLQVAALERKM